jgi:hypothetical protein
MSNNAVGPEDSLTLLKRLVKRVEEGEMRLWLFIYPLHSIRLTRWVADHFEEETRFDIGFSSPQGLTSAEFRFIAARLNQRANELDEISRC